MKSLIFGALAVLFICGGCQGALPTFSTCTKPCGTGESTSSQFSSTTLTLECNTVSCTAPAPFGACTESCGGGNKTRPGDVLPCNTQACSLPNLSSCKADLFFLLDRSGSVNEMQFELAKQMISDVIRTQNVGSDAVHVGVISYAYEAKLEYFETSSAATAANKALAIKRTGGTTLPAYAFAELINQLGLVGRADVPKVVVIVTDGAGMQDVLRSQLNDLIATAVNKHGVTIYGVSTTSNVIDLNPYTHPDRISELVKINSWTTLANNIITNANCGAVTVSPPDSDVLTASNKMLESPLLVGVANRAGEVCGQYSDWGPCSIPCGAKGLQERTRVCITKVNGHDTERVTVTDVRPCFTACTTTTTTTTPKPTTTSDGICERCDYTKGQIWVSDEDNCHKYYICEKVDDDAGMWYWRKWHVHCGLLYWSPERLTCVPELPSGCVDGPAEVWQGPSTTIGPCPFVVLADPQLFEHVDTQEIFNCTEGMVFNETECTCVVDGLVQPECTDDLFLHFPYNHDVNFDDITCHKAKGYSYGKGEVKIVNDPTRGPVAEFDGESRLEVAFMRNWFEENNVESFTVALWVNSDPSNSGKVGFVNNGDCIDDATFSVFGDASGGAVGMLDTDDSPATQTASAPIPNTWTHLAMVYDIIGMKLYVNGAPGTSVDIMGPISNVQNPMVVGCACTQFIEGHFKGRIDELRLYRRALSDAEVMALANA